MDEGKKEIKLENKFNEEGSSGKNERDPKNEKRSINKPKYKNRKRKPHKKQVNTVKRKKKDEIEASEIIDDVSSNNENSYPPVDQKDIIKNSRKDEKIKASDIVDDVKYSTIYHSINQPIGAGKNNYIAVSRPDNKVQLFTRRVYGIKRKSKYCPINTPLELHKIDEGEYIAVSYKYVAFLGHHNKMQLFVRNYYRSGRKSYGKVGRNIYPPINQKDIIKVFSEDNNKIASDLAMKYGLVSVEEIKQKVKNISQEKQKEIIERYGSTQNDSCSSS